MSIVVQCDCGKKYKLSDDKAGKRFKCKECGEPIVVRRVKKTAPVPDDDWGDLDEYQPVTTAKVTRDSSKRGRKRKKQSQKSTLPVWIGGGVAVVAVIAGAVFFFSGEPAGSNTATSPDESSSDESESEGAKSTASEIAESGPASSNTATSPDESSSDESESEGTKSTASETNSIGMQFRLLPSGTFTMGSDSSDRDNEKPPHTVTLTKPFYLGVYEVTQQQYGQVMGKNPSEYKGAQNPVETVSWEDAVEFCRRLSKLPEEQSAGRFYRLPTEAEWEYACRAGTTTKYSFGDDESQLGEYGWFRTNSGKSTHPVGQKKANAWGLYDMHGNVLEWCQDWYDGYPRGSVSDPPGPSKGSSRVDRGGGWHYYSVGCRSAYRDNYAPDFRYYYLGFRVLRSSVK